MPKNDHQSRKDSERVVYDEVRSTGVTRDNARRVAQEASERAHRNLDKNKAGK